MKKDIETFKEIRKAYPQTMSKDQFYRVAHISKSTALYLLQSGLVPCHDTGKKTRRYTIKTDDVIKYLIDRRACPWKYSASPGWYAGTAGEKSCDRFPSTMTLTKTEKALFRKYLTMELSAYDDLMSVADTSVCTGYSKTTVIGWCNKDLFKHFHIDGHFLIPKTVLVEFMASASYDSIRVKSEVHKVMLCDFFEEIGKNKKP